jgi:hypothetical protein
MVQLSCIRGRRKHSMDYNTRQKEGGRNMNLWELKSIEYELDYRWKIGQLGLWMRPMQLEWLIGYEYDTNEDNNAVVIAELSRKPETVRWNRFIFSGTTQYVQLVPVMPDRAVVVHVELPVKILPKSRAQFFIRIPVWIRVFTGKSTNNLLTEIPTLQLSNSWFGDIVSGELCYGLDTRARRTIDQALPYTGFAVCPVWINNDSQGQIDFQKVCVHVEHLKIFAGTEKLWTNEVTIRFFGTEQPSQVNFSSERPSWEKGCRLVSEERVPVTKSLVKKSLGVLKHFTTFD